MSSRFHRLYPYVWRQRWPIAGGLVCLLVGNYLDVQAAVLLGGGVDVAAFNMGKLGGAQATLLWMFVLLIFGLGLQSAILRYYMRQWIIGASREVETDLRNDVFSSLLRQSPGFYDRYRTGDLMNRASSDIEAVRVVVGPAVMYMANTLAMLPMALYQMLRISPALAGLVAIPMLLIVPLFYFFKRGIHARFKRTQELMSDLSASVQENLSGVRVIKVHAREAQQAAGFEALSNEYVRENLALARVQAVFMPMLGFLVGMGILALLWGGGWLILQGQMTIGGLISFFVMMMSSVWPLIAFGWVLAQLERGAASLARIEEIIDARPEIDLKAGTAGEAPELRAGLELRDLTFTYPTGNAPALRGLTITVPPGTTLGLTGPVGCGKSTLAALLARRYNPPRGTLLVDGRDILDWPVEALRRQIGIVDQEPFLFSDTIEANILFGVEPAGRTAEDLHALAVRAAETAQLAGEVERFPHGYETILGERGINLSGGQRQRAALARAIARDPGLLILDDALAAVDTHTEEAILRGLREVLRGRTTLLISHRVSTMGLADWIVYLEEGRAVEQGTHEELLARRGAYWRLAQRQLLAEQIEQTA